ncbi:MAG: InlB B-repeat-containing protein, partial [Lachnospiraceae bacterium]|nr:InlB B-repeat-containing protein [Lachnospiraceae bacterium]
DVTTVEYGEIPQHEALFKKADPQFEYTFTGWSPSLKAVTGAAEYTAQFSETVNSHEIVWKDENGNIIDTTTVEYGSMPLHPDLNNKETKEFFYEFEGWEPELKEVTGPAEYQAKFLETRKSYEIIWKYENGLVIDAKTWEYGTVPSCEDPEMEATPEFEYVFNGWDPEITEVDGAAVYTAKFTPARRSYVITWQDDEGNVFDTTMVEYGSLPSHEDPVKKDTDECTYSFKGWNRDFKAVAGPETYVARFDKTRRSYEITWKNEDGSVIDVTTVEYGTEPAHDNLTGSVTDESIREFAGWNPAVTAVTGPAEYQAQFTTTPRSYEITWKNDDGSVIDVTEAAYGTVPEHAEAVKKETVEYTYEFAGWDKEVEAVTGPAEYTAKFKPVKRSYEITWKNDDGSVIDVTKAEYGTVPELVTADKKETAEYTYEFAGWDKEVVSVIGPAEYTAKFKPVKRSYEITWKDEDGKVIDTTLVEYGAVPTHVGLTREETDEFTYEFAGWDPEIKAVTGPAEYQAKYNSIKKEYTVRFVTNGGTAIDEAKTEYGQCVSKPVDPERDGYTFTGWFADENLTVTYDFEEPVIGELTIYADWKLNEKVFPPIPELTEDQKPVPIENLVEDGTEQALVRAPKKLPEGYTVKYSTDGGKTWSEEVPTGKESGKYTIRVHYQADSDHIDFDGDTLYVMIRGVYYQAESDGDWTKESGKTYTVRVKKLFNDEECFANFTGVMVDGKTAERDKDYTAIGGSTIITFASEYLETLSVGEHLIDITFRDGETSVVLRVLEEEKVSPTPTPTATPAPTATPTPTATPAPTATPTPTPTPEPMPRTGDTAMPMIWVFLIPISAACIVVAINRKRRFGRER